MVLADAERPTVRASAVMTAEMRRESFKTVSSYIETVYKNFFHF